MILNVTSTVSCLTPVSCLELDRARHFAQNDSSYTAQEKWLLPLLEKNDALTQLKKNDALES